VKLKSILSEHGLSETTIRQWDIWDASPDAFSRNLLTGLGWILRRSRPVIIVSIPSPRPTWKTVLVVPLAEKRTSEFDVRIPEKIPGISKACFAQVAMLMSILKTHVLGDRRGNLLEGKGRPLTIDIQRALLQIMGLPRQFAKRGGE